LDIRINLFSETVARHWNQATQGNGGDIITGIFQETWRCSTQGHGLVGNTGGMWTVGLDDLVFSSLSDSVIL